MVAPFAISVAIASLALVLNLNAKEEIVKVATASVALVCVLLSLFFAPLLLKVLAVAISFLGGKSHLFPDW